MRRAAAAAWRRRRRGSGRSSARRMRRRRARELSCACRRRVAHAKRARPSRVANSAPGCAWVRKSRTRAHACGARHLAASSDAVGMHEKAGGSTEAAAARAACNACRAHTRRRVWRKLVVGTRGRGGAGESGKWSGVREGEGSGKEDLGREGSGRARRGRALSGRPGHRGRKAHLPPEAVWGRSRARRIDATVSGS
eukprot:6905878-Prymnesium_polylepis.1